MGMTGPLLCVGAEFADGPDERHSLEYFAEDDVLAVESGRGRESDEELRVVGVLARVGHGDPARAVLKERVRSARRQADERGANSRAAG